MTVDEESRPLLRLLLRLLLLPLLRYFSFHTNIFVVNNRYCWGCCSRSRSCCSLPWNKEDLELLDSVSRGPRGRSIRIQKCMRMMHDESASKDLCFRDLVYVKLSPSLAICVCLDSAVNCTQCAWRCSPIDHRTNQSLQTIQHGVVTHQ